MKQFPLIGRIQEKLATGKAPPRDEARAPIADPSVRSQADWLMEGIRRLAAEFRSLAGQAGWVPAATREDHLRALLLAYKLTLTASRQREAGPDREVLALVRLGILRELADADTSGNQSRPLLDSADSDIAASVIRFDAGLPNPLAPFYGDLAPTFGGPCTTGDLAVRYGRIVRHLYDSLQKKLDERERASASVRYARAGR